MKERRVLAKPEHEVVFDELKALIMRHANKITSEELLAIAANLVGKIIAFQDPNVMSLERANLIVAANMERGNEEAVARLMDDTAGSA